MKAKILQNRQKKRVQYAFIYKFIATNVSYGSRGRLVERNFPRFSDDWPFAFCFDSFILAQYLLCCLFGSFPSTWIFIVIFCTQQLDDDLIGVCWSLWWCTSLRWWQSSWSAQSFNQFESISPFCNRSCRSPASLENNDIVPDDQHHHL